MVSLMSPPRSSLLPELVDGPPVGERLTQAEERGVGQQDVPRRALGEAVDERVQTGGEIRRQRYDPFRRHPRVLESVRHIRAANAGRKERRRAFTEQLEVDV